MVKYIKSQEGLSLIEVIVGSALFLVVAMAAYGAYSSLFQVAYLDRVKVMALGLADEQMEMVRGMSYADIGLVGGNPPGLLAGTQNVTRGNISFTVMLDIRNVTSRAPLFGGGKLIDIEVSCQDCKSSTPVTLVGEVFPVQL